MNEFLVVMAGLAKLGLVLSLQTAFILLLRKPVRSLLGAVAAYRLWSLVLLWLPCYLLGGFIKRALPGSAMNRLDVLPGLDHIGMAGDPVAEWLPILTLPAPEPAAMGSLSASTFNWGALLAVLWLLGTGVLLVRQLWQMLVFAGYVRRNAAAVTNHIWELEVGGRTPVVTLRGMGCAALYGIGSPLLLLPEHFMQQHDADQQFLILQHEAVHRRRHDNAWNLLASSLLLLFWWNPLLWLAWRNYRSDQELSCDAQALAVCSRKQQLGYANTLLDSLENFSNFRHAPLLSAWGNLDSSKERILMISKLATLKTRPKLGMALIVVLALAGGALALSVSTKPAVNADTQPAPALAETGVKAVPAIAKPEPVVSQQETVVENKKAEVASENKNVVAQQQNDRPADELSASVRLNLQQISEFLNAKNYDEAKALIAELEEKFIQGRLNARESVVVFQFKMQLMTLQEKYAEAREAVDQVLSIKEAAPDLVRDMQFQKAQLYVQEGKYDLAAPAVSQWLNDYPDKASASANYMAAATYYSLKQNDVAIPYAEKAYQMNQQALQEGKQVSGLQSSAQFLGTLYITQGKLDSATPVFEDLVARFPENKNNAINLSTVYIGLGRVAEARTLLQNTAEHFQDPKAQQMLQKLEARMAANLK